MLSIDLEKLSQFENSRGVFYLSTLAAAFCPAFVELYWSEPALVKNHFALAIILAASVGVVGLVLFVFAGFLNSFRIHGEPSSWAKHAGLSALVVGPVNALLFQLMAMAIVEGRGLNFRTFVLLYFLSSLPLLAIGVFRMERTLNKGQVNVKRLSEVTGARGKRLQLLKQQIQSVGIELHAAASLEEKQALSDRLAALSAQLDEIENDAELSALSRSLGMNDHGEPRPESR